MTEPYDWEPHLGGDNNNEELPPIVRWTEPGQIVAGTITDVRDHEDKKFGRGTFPKLTLDTDHGPLCIFAQQVGLKRQLAEWNPQVGDRVKIRYDGEEKLDSGFSIKRFTVKVAKAVTADPETAPF